MYKYRIEGDGTRGRTTVWRDGGIIPWTKCVIRVANMGCMAYVDSNPGHLERVVLTGVYILIGDGTFNNTKLIVGDDLFRGIQSVKLTIETGKDPIIDISAVFLPNLIEGEESD